MDAARIAGEIFENSMLFAAKSFFRKSMKKAQIEARKRNTDNSFHVR